MSWISKLVETYDNAMAQDEQDRPEAVFHINLNVDMIVRINKQGNFLGAEKITEKYKKPVPVTLDSPGRSGTNFNAHSLTDQL